MKREIYSLVVSLILFISGYAAGQHGDIVKFINYFRLTNWWIVLFFIGTLIIYKLYGKILK